MFGASFIAQAKRASRWMGVLAVLLFVVGVGTYALLKKPFSSAPPDRVAIAGIIQSAAGLVLIAAENGFFQEKNLDVVYHPYVLGMQALQAVLNDEADMAIAADIPFMFAVMKGEDIAIFATIYESRRDLALLTASDRGIRTPRDLAGKTIGASRGTTLQFFLDAMLLANDIPEETVTFVDLKPEEFADALFSRRVDAVIVFPPYMEDLQARLGERAVIFRGEDLYTSRFNLIAKRDYLEKHSDAAKKVIAALSKAEGYAVEHPAQAQEIVSRHIKLSKREVERMFSDGQFYLSLEQSLLLALDEETRWAINRELVKAALAPNYLDYLRLEPLLAVKPDAVKVIH